MPEDKANSWETRADTYSLYGFTDLPTMHERGTVVLTHGKGPYVYDVHGRPGSRRQFGPVEHGGGLRPPRPDRRRQAQYDRFPGYHAFFGRLSDQTVMLSEKAGRGLALSARPEGVLHQFSGSEANDTMVKMLWFLMHRQGKPSGARSSRAVNAYHGVTVVSASMTGKPYNAVRPAAAGLHPPHLPALLARGAGGRDRGRLHRAHGRRARGGHRPRGRRHHRGLLGRTRHGRGRGDPAVRGLFPGRRRDPAPPRHPADRGRGDLRLRAHGRVWGCQTYGFMPDAIISSKNLTAGYFPMGAVILGPDLSDRLQAASEAVEEFPHGFTASGHPVGCAIALKAIDVIVATNPGPGSRMSAA
jgi:4-aminobutyrate---pyruvate transaminase